MFSNIFNNCALSVVDKQCKEVLLGCALSIVDKQSEEAFFLIRTRWPGKTQWKIYPYSLKDKRSAVRSLKDRVRSKFNASVAEVGYQDKWQRSVVVVCFVGGDKRHLESDAAHVRTICEEAVDVEIVAINQEWL